MADISVSSAVLTDPAGRRENEDAVYSCEHIEPGRLSRRGKLYIVADGTGGQAGGGTASAHAIKVVSDTFYEGTNGTGDVGEDLRAAIQAGHRSLYRLAQDAPSWKDMSTTIVATVVQDDQLYVAHVGDSRAYLVRDKKVRQITRDHVWEEDDEQFGSLTRWLGGAEHPTVEVDLSKQTLQEGDVVILATDGLTGHVDEDEMLPVVSTHAVREAAKLMIELAKHHGTKDNVSVAVVRYGGAKIEGAAARQKLIWVGVGIAVTLVLAALGILLARGDGGGESKPAVATPHSGDVLIGITVSPEQIATQTAVAPGVATKTSAPVGPTATRLQATNTPTLPPTVAGRPAGPTPVGPAVSVTPLPCVGNQVWNGKECTCPAGTIWIPQSLWCVDDGKGGDGGGNVVPPPR
jgi:protein phosphatase